MKPNTNRQFWGSTKTALHVTFEDGRSCFVRYDGMIFPAGETDWEGFWDGAVCGHHYTKILAGMEFNFWRSRGGTMYTYLEVPPDWALGDLVNELVPIHSVSEFAIDGKMLEVAFPW